MTLSLVRTNEDLPEAKPCPFCGAKKIGQGLGIYSDSVGTFIGCQGCGARGAYTKLGHCRAAWESAIELWNKRAQASGSEGLT